MPHTARRCALFDFSELCCSNVGAAEFITIANHFHTVAIRGVPRMTVANKNEARRFIVLIDELYEHRCKLLCSAAVPPAELFVAPSAVDAAKRVAVQRHAKDFEADMRDELLEKRGVSDFADTTLDADALFTGDEEAFSFARAVSRLNEMQSERYLLAKWVGMPPKDSAYLSH